MRNLILIIVIFSLLGCDEYIITAAKKKNNKADGLPRCVRVAKADYFTVYRCPIGGSQFLYCTKTNAGVSSSLTCAR